MRKLTKLERYGLLAIFCMVAIYVYVKLFHERLEADIVREQRQVDSLHERRGELLGQIPNQQDTTWRLRLAQAATRRLERRLAEAKTVLVTPDQVTAPLRAITESAETHGLNVLRSEPVQRDAHTELPGGELLEQAARRRMEMVGSFHDLLRFVLDLPRVTDKVVVVESIRVTLEDPDTGRVRANMDLLL